MFGVTKMGHVAVMEVVGEAFTVDDAVECVKRLYGVRSIIEGAPLGPSMRYEERRWVEYGLEELPVKVSVVSVEGHTLAMMAEVRDVFISRAIIAGDFNASPPMEPFSLAARLEGSQPNELVAYNIILAARTGVEFAGVSQRDFETAVSELVRLAEHIA